MKEADEIKNNFKVSKLPVQAWKFKLKPTEVVGLSQVAKYRIHISQVQTY